MTKINKLFGPGQYIVLKDIIVAGYTEIQMIQDLRDSVGIRYGGVRPRYIASSLIPAKTIVTIVRHTKNYRDGGFISEIDLTCSDDSFYTYSCVIYGDTHNVLKELDGVSKVLYGDS